MCVYIRETIIFCGGDINIGIEVYRMFRGLGSAAPTDLLYTAAGREARHLHTQWKALLPPYCWKRKIDFEGRYDVCGSYLQVCQRE